MVDGQAPQTHLEFARTRLQCERESRELAATSEVYGKLDHPRFSEDDGLILEPTSQSRWCYAAARIIAAVLALIGHPKAYGEVFNVGHTKEISIYDLAELDLPGMLEWVIAYGRERGE